eukprot:Blabericola_migrator_1__5647@NODE_286_length_10380_cov_74_401920_g236_i0_p6_GENE_NODE_286_length_10380_cov_74_401920_g236_i0NODE_286_length_10380_cov_74_401920_g236_i0_p6_ORF_typecomplete_len161_score25_46Methyltransf_11/PF08241_12/0_097_NODE_286_length_10380_cov_74_401920_g236_i019362418
MKTLIIGSVVTSLLTIGSVVAHKMEVERHTVSTTNVSLLPSGKRALNGLGDFAIGILGVEGRADLGALGGGALVFGELDFGELVFGLSWSPDFLSAALTSGASTSCPASAFELPFLGKSFDFVSFAFSPPSMLRSALPGGSGGRLNLLRGVLFSPKSGAI